MVSSPPAASDGLYYLHTDHLGSVTLMTLPSGALHSEGTAQYQPFGGFQQPPAANPGLTRQGYTGHHHHNTGDSDIGLIYMNARYYLPGLARFASPDSLIPDPANPQALNRYTYTYNNPINYTDPSGHCPAPEGGTGNVICVGLFIADDTILFGTGYGDGRTFSADSGRFQSRGLSLPPKTGQPTKVDRGTIQASLWR